MITLKFILIALSCYLLGCFSVGYYLVYFTKHIDIRKHGSGSTGANNVKRLLGKKGYFITIFGDVLRGVVAVLLANYFKLNPLEVILCIILTLVGHLWPIQLRFHGGKGLAVTLGMSLIYDFRLAIGFAIIFLISSIFSKNLVLKALIGILLIPLYAIILKKLPIDIIGMSCLCLLILFGHRKNIKNLINTYYSGRL